MANAQLDQFPPAAAVYLDSPVSLTDDAVRDTIYRMFQQGAGTSVRTVKRAIVNKGFTISDRRVSRLLRQARATATAPNIAVLSGGSWHGRDSISEKLLLTRREFDDQSSLLAVVSELLHSNEPRLLGRFYDRSTAVLDWYYEVYAKPHTPSQAEDSGARLDRVNPLGVMVQDPRGDPSPVLDEVVILKNAPTSNASLDSTIFYGSLVSTLWFYKQSGSNPSDIVRLRELERFLVRNF